MMNTSFDTFILSHPNTGEMHFNVGKRCATVSIFFRSTTDVAGTTIMLGTEGGTIAPFTFIFEGPRAQVFGKHLARRLWNHMIKSDWSPKEMIGAMP
jgi:hypothetical protein